MCGEDMLKTGLFKALQLFDCCICDATRHVSTQELTNQVIGLTGTVYHPLITSPTTHSRRTALVRI